MSFYDSAARRRPLIDQMGEILQSRTLLKLLIHRDLHVRYKRSFLGIWWSLLNPILTTVVLYFVFNAVFMVAMPTRISFIPYLLSGVLMITFFNQGLNIGADSVANGSGLLNKQYVRPEVFVLSSVIASAINFLAGLLPLTIVIYMAHLKFGAETLLLVPLIFFLILYISGLSLIIAILYIYFDDLKSVISVALLLMQYLTPVFYPLSALGDTSRTVIQLNPLTSFLEIFRDLTGQATIASINDWYFISVSSILVFLIGAFIFEKSWKQAVTRL